jgi:D-psicose/D-tagatose/L-ribulose 3-epimerase
VRACIDHAAGIGATVVAGPLYSPTGQTGQIDDFRRIRHRDMQTLTPTPRGQILDVLIRNLSPLILYAGERGIRLAIEPLNRFETSLFNTVRQTMGLIQMVNHPSLGLLLDTFHMNIEERDIGEAIRHAGKKLFHFHASGNDRGAPGNDGIDWLSVRGALDDIGYSGMVSIESFTSANRTIATAASIWRPLAPSQDALAENGLAFLRELFI